MMTTPRITIGLDLGDRYSQLYVVDAAGALVEEGRVATTREALRQRFERERPCRVVMEAGAQTAWVARELAALGHEVVVANGRKLRWLYANEHKTDRVDAAYLARVGRWDPTLLAPIRLRGPAAAAALRVLRARGSLVQARTRLINHVRGAVKTVGARLPACSAASFARRVGAAVPPELRPAVAPVLEQIAALTRTIAAYDRQIDRMATETYPETTRLRQVAGVGALTALAFVLVLEDPQRFASGRMVGAYLGLCPRRADSGAQRPQLGITKCGDGLLRQLLVQAAHYVLGPFGPDCELRRWGLELARRGGKNAKKRAVVAVARKLAALLYSLWVHERDYEPLRSASAA
jgi:transposase